MSSNRKKTSISEVSIETLKNKITKPALDRIIQRAGVKRKTKDIYQSLREVISSRLRDVVSDSIIFMNHSNRKTVYINDISAALENRGTPLAAGVNEHAKHTASLQSSNSRGKSSGTKKEAPATDQEKTTKHRYRPGTVSLRNIKRQQKESDSLAIPKLNFQSLVRKISTEFKADVRFSSSVIDLLQLAVESDIITLCRKANRVAIHAKRETLQASDINVTLSIMDRPEIYL